MEFTGFPSFYSAERKNEGRDREFHAPTILKQLVLWHFEDSLIASVRWHLGELGNFLKDVAYASEQLFLLYSGLADQESGIGNVLLTPGNPGEKSVLPASATLDCLSGNLNSPGRNSSTRGNNNYINIEVETVMWPSWGVLASKPKGKEGSCSVVLDDWSWPLRSN